MHSRRRYRRHRRRSRPAPAPPPARFTRRDDTTFWAWDERGSLLGYVFGSPHELRYKAVHTYALVTDRDETSYWAWDERALLLGIISTQESGVYNCYLPDGTLHQRHLPENTLGNAWKWLRASRAEGRPVR